MIKIQMKESASQIVFQIEGRLAASFVPELEQCWNAARAVDPERKISVDLKDVTCVDRAGRHLLRKMHIQGVTFVRAGIAVQDILEQVMEQACKS